MVHEVTGSVCRSTEETVAWMVTFLRRGSALRAGKEGKQVAAAKVPEPRVAVSRGDKPGSSGRGSRRELDHGGSKRWGSKQASN